MTATLLAGRLNVATLAAAGSVPAVMSTLLAGLALLALRAVLGATGRVPSRRAAYLLDGVTAIVVVAFVILVAARFDHLD